MKKFLLALILSVATLQPVSAQSYRGFADIEAGIIISSSGWIKDPIIGITTTHGVQLAEMFFIGAGTGILTNIHSAAMPLFCDLRFDWFSGKKVSPFIDLKTGYTLKITDAIYDNIDSGLYLNPTIGCRIRLNNRTGINIGLSYNSVRCDDWSSPAHAIAIKAGIDF